ncbi:MAG: type I methionyl aminopeptidase [Bacteroidia bacterium]
MVYLKTQEEIELLRESNLLVSKTLAEVAKHIKEGVSYLSLDKIAETFIKDNNAIAAFKGYRGFPGSLCISPNSEVVHGIPSDTLIKNGDLLSIDCGILKNSFYGDSAFTFAVGDITENNKKLLQVTKTSLYLAIEKAVVGNRVGDISNAVQAYCESFGYGVVRELTGHGVGKSLHEEPEVPNYGKKGSGLLLKKGMVIAIEPMINEGVRHVKFYNDGWTVKTKDLKMSAHFEHSVAIDNGKADILSDFDIIYTEINKNSNLNNSYLIN